MNFAIRSKMKWLILPAQSGKTRKVEDKIALMNTLNHKFNPDRPSELNVWISANNKLLVQQTTTRFKNDLGLDESDDEANEVCDAMIRGSIFSWMSGNKNTNIKPKELAYHILQTDDETRVDMIVMCANKSRVKYLSDLLKLVGNKRRISIWIDEADRTVKLWLPYAAEFLSHLTVRQMTLVSATFNAVREKVGDVEVLPYSVTVPDCYRGLEHCNTIINDGPFGAVDYVDMILEKHKSTLAVPGMRAFIPGNNAKVSHEHISTLLLHKYGFAVLIINGTHKEIRLPTGDTIDLRDFLTAKHEATPTEFNTILATKYEELNLKRFPLAITGYMCVERGVTFQTVPIEGLHDGFLFDYGIIASILDSAEAYQTMARLFGNIGNSPHYKTVDIYTNAGTFSRVSREEKIAMNIAKIAEKYNAKTIGDLEIELACGDGTNHTIHQDDFQQEWSEVPIAEALLDPELSSYVRERSRDENGCYKTAFAAAAKVHSYADALKIKNGSKTAQLRVNAEDMEIGESQTRNLIAYHDVTDPGSGVVITRTITRVQDTKSIEDRVKERHTKATSGNPF